MSDIRFHVAGRGARDAAPKLGAMIEGELGRRPVTKAVGDAVELTFPAEVFKAVDVQQHRELVDRIRRIIGWAQWEARNGLLVTARGVDGRPELRLDDTDPEAVLALSRPL